MSSRLKNVNELPKAATTTSRVVKRLRVSLEPIIFFYVLALHLQNPLLQQYALVRYGEDAGLNASSVIGRHSCDHGMMKNSTLKSLIKELHAKAATFQTGLMLFETLPSAVVCLFLGSISDKIGRKPIMALSLMSSLVEAAFILITMHLKLDVRVIYIGSFLNGVGGYFTSLQMILMAVVADVTPREDRYFRLGILHSFAFFAGIGSSLLSGVLIQRLGYLRTYWIVSALFLVAFLYGIFVLKETRPRTQSTDRSDFNWKAIWRYPITAVRCLISPKIGRWKIVIMFFAQLFNYMLFIGAAPLYTLYALGQPFCLSSAFVGYFLATRFACIGFGTPIFLKLLRFLPDHGMAIVGLVSTAAGFAALFLAKTTTALFLAWLWTVACGVPGAIYRAVMSNNVGEENQGKIFSLVASVEIVFIFIGNASFNSVYSVGLKQDFPGLAFLLGLGITVIPFLLTVCYGIALRFTDNNDSSLSDETDYEPIPEDLDRHDHTN